jgi:hypothetical protein
MNKLTKDDILGVCTSLDDEDICDLRLVGVRLDRLREVVQELMVKCDTTPVYGYEKIITVNDIINDLFGEVLEDV